MLDYLPLLKQAKIGSIIPLCKEINKTCNSADYFAHISDYGNRKYSFLLESADYIADYGERSIGSASPCLTVRGKNAGFEVTALNELGENFLAFLEDKNAFSFCDYAEYNKKSVKGSLKPDRKIVSEKERLKLKNHMDILREIAFAFTPVVKPFTTYAGLFGAFSYDFIDQFEDLPENKEDNFNLPDYELHFADNLFLINNRKGKTYFVSNALVMDDNFEELYDRCCAKIEGMGTAFEEVYNMPVHPKRFSPKKGSIESDVSREEFMEKVRAVKQHIVEGDVFQTVISRTITADYNAEPLEIYKELRSLNPSPYMFYFNNPESVLLGASPEMFIRVNRENSKNKVEIKPIAGTRPRGFLNGSIDNDLDSKYEAELRLDEKELAEHTMLVDLARNDVARISKKGTRAVSNPYSIEKYSHVQHLVSSVSGELKDELDSLHALLASMNMGTLTGTPKIEAMKLIRKYERNARGYYGGAVGYITPSDEMDSAIIIRSMHLKEGKAFVRAGAGIVFDSSPEKEFIESEKKAEACLAAIKKTGGVHYE